MVGEISPRLSQIPDATVFRHSNQVAQPPVVPCASIVKDHWSIESSHRVRDNTSDGGRPQIRIGTLPGIPATLRNPAIEIIHT